MSRRDVLDQLASFRTEVEDEARARDLEAIRIELLRTSPVPAAPRRRFALVVVVTMMLAGPAAALAADDALPGDLLYPVKRVAEPILQLLDDQFVAEHRIEEVAGLVDRDMADDVIRERVEMARDALARTDAPELEAELDRIVDQWSSDRVPEPDQTSGPSPTTTVPVRTDATSDRRSEGQIDAPESTTTTETRSSVADPAPDRSTTTTAPRDTDRLPPDDRPRDAP